MEQGEDFSGICGFGIHAESGIIPLILYCNQGQSESGKIIHVLFIQTIENHKIVLGDCPFEKGLVITVEFPVIIVLVPGLGKAVKISYELI